MEISDEKYKRLIATIDNFRMQVNYLHGELHDIEAAIYELKEAAEELGEDNGTEV